MGKWQFHCRYPVQVGEEMVFYTIATSAAAITILELRQAGIDSHADNSLSLSVDAWETETDDFKMT